MKQLMILAVALLVLEAAVKADAQYTITDLGTLGGNSSYANGINDNGQVVGYSYPAGVIEGGMNARAFLYSDGVMQDLGSLGDTSGHEGSWAYGINNNSQVVGSSNILDGHSGAMHAILYSDGIMQDLGSLGGRSSVATGINDNGQVIGYSDIPGNSNWQAFLYSNGVMQNLGPLGVDSWAKGINASSQIVGGSNGHAFLYSEGIMQDLGTLGGMYSDASAINDSAQIVGYASTNIEDVQPTTQHAFVYSEGIMQDLGTLGGGRGWSWAKDINNNGQVVGYSDVEGDSAVHAFIYSGGLMKDLNTLIPSDSGWKLRWAHGINDSGQIVGGGINPEGYDRAFLLTPIPEPCTLLLLGLGGVMIRRR